MASTGFAAFAANLVQGLTQGQLLKQDREREKQEKDVLMKIAELNLENAEQRQAAFGNVTRALNGQGAPVPSFETAEGGLGLERTGEAPGPVTGVAQEPELIDLLVSGLLPDLTSFQRAETERGVAAQNSALLQRLMPGGEGGGGFELQDVVFGPSGPTPRIGRTALDTPLDPTDLARFRTSDGQIPPPGSTMRSIHAAGGRQITTAEAGSEASTRATQEVIGQLQTFVDDLFQGDPGILNRAAEAAKRGFEFVSQTNPDVAAYIGFSEGTIAPLIRQLGDKGSLAEGDVGRGLSLIPSILPFPDTKEVAQKKMAILQQVVDAATQGGPRAAARVLDQAQEGGLLEEPQVIDFSELPQ